MALKHPKGPSGTLVVLEHTSKILKDNPLGDPSVRKVAVWLPPQYDEGAGRRRFPVLYDLVGFTGSGLSHTNWKPFGDNVPERAARLLGAAEALRNTIGAAPTFFARSLYEHAVTATHAQIDTAAAGAWAEGQVMTLEQAIATALDGDN